MLCDFGRRQGIPAVWGLCANAQMLQRAKRRTKPSDPHSACKPRKTEIFFGNKVEKGAWGNYVNDFCLSAALAWFCLVFRPGRCQDLLLVTAQAPCGIQPPHRGSSTRAGEPDPVSIRPQMARERRGDPSKPSNSLFSQFDIPARAGAGGSGEQRALTGSSQLSSKKLQFCKQSSAAPLGLAGKGLGPPHPIHRRTCRSREKSISVSTSTSERNGSAGRKGTGRQRHCWAPAAAASQGHS